MSVNGPDTFSYEQDDRLAILASISLSQGETGEELILGCERLAQTFLNIEDFYNPLPSDREFRQRLHKMASLLRELNDLVSFDDDWDTAKKFWSAVLTDRKGRLPKWRTKRFAKISDHLELALHYLEPIALNQGLSPAAEIDCGRNYIDEQRNNSQTGYLKQLSCLYYQILGRKPGRSKSTIGPFVRFAHAAMLPVLGHNTPHIETLNERWARLKFDPCQIKACGTSAKISQGRGEKSA